MDDAISANGEDDAGLGGCARMKWGRILRWGITVAWWAATFFGLPVPRNWSEVNSASVEIDTWFLRHDLSPIAVGIGIGLLFGWAIAPEAVSLYRRHLERLEAKGSAAESLRQMDVFDIAEHLLRKSRWGWRALARLNFKAQVVASVPHEMHRAAASGAIRMIGRRPNTATIEKIDRAYWRFADIDDNRLWDRRNRSKTILRTGEPVPRLQAYFDLTAPAIDVWSTWPAASPLFKVGVWFWLLLKTSFYRVRGRLLRLRHRLFG